MLRQFPTHSSLLYLYVDIEDISGSLLILFSPFLIIKALWFGVFSHPTTHCIFPVFRRGEELFSQFQDNATPFNSDRFRTGTFTSDCMPHKVIWQQRSLLNTLQPSGQSSCQGSWAILVACRHDMMCWQWRSISADFLSRTYNPAWSWKQSWKNCCRGSVYEVFGQYPSKLSQSSETREVWGSVVAERCLRRRDIKCNAEVLGQKTH